MSDERKQELQAVARIWYGSPESLVPVSFEEYVKEYLGWEVSVLEACNTIKSIMEDARPVEEILAINPQS
ncbi:hypothetical protein KKD19_06655 [Patescibacteria group bacterium]|nr:hypothetical protein [Patescibacteria group bacterium]MCG2693161.1 hypothetical protein [Candidatus Parcubacteria bacterium]